MKRRWDAVAEIVQGAERGAELGVWKGQTFFYLLDRMPSLVLIGVDCWPTSTVPHAKSMELGRSTWYPPEVIQGHRQRVLDRAIQYGDRAVLLELDTVDAAVLVDDQSLDFVFIDADHSEEGVLRDIAAWTPKLRPGGILLGHDRNWPSVRRALEQSFPSWREHPDNVWSA